MDVKVKGMMKCLTYSWGVVPALESASPTSCKHQSNLLIPSAQKINQETKNLEKELFLLQCSTYAKVRAKTGGLGTQL